MILPKFQSPSAAPENKFEQDLEQGLDQFAQSLVELLNGGLKFEDNFNCYITTITTDATPGNQTAITHGLKRTPSGCIILERINKAGDIYLGASGKDATTYNIASDVASLNAKIMVF